MYRHIAQNAGFGADEEMERFCLSADLNDSRFGSVVCALAEKGASDSVVKITRARLSEALRDDEASNAAHMLGVALLTLKIDVSALIQEIYASGDIAEKKWAIAQTGFSRRSKAAFERLRDWFKSSPSGLRPAVIAALGQVQLPEATRFLLSEITRMSKEERLVATYAVMSGALTDEMKDDVIAWQRSEKDSQVAARLPLLLRRF